MLNLEPRVDQESLSGTDEEDEAVAMLSMGVVVVKMVGRRGR